VASSATIQTVQAAFYDAALYEDDAAGVPRLSRAALFAPLSRALDLAEGRTPGHAVRVAYVAITLAEACGMAADMVNDVFYAALLHDAGMAASGPSPRPARASRLPLVPGPGENWGDVVDALSMHCDLGAEAVRRLGFSDGVVTAVANHHTSWAASGSRADFQPAAIVSAADRLESMIDTPDLPPLKARRKGPELVREMSGVELSPDVADQLARLAGRDEFWLGFYDTDLPATLMGRLPADNLNSAQVMAVFGAISDIVDIRNGRLAGRGRRIGDLARSVALRSGIAERRADVVRIAALLQDVGTLGIPAHIMAKPDILTLDEMFKVQQHATIARDILSEIPGLGAAAWWVGCHHERVDGKGYPGLLEGDEVPVEAQIIGICEAFDALTSDRPHRRRLSVNDALDVLAGLAGVRFSADLVERFDRMVDPAVA
jgi:putative nucleotidyltransferase with HDIG domain